MAKSPYKLLLLASFFPPLGIIASVRAWNIAKHLTRMGWRVTVVTPAPSLWRRVENEEAVDAELKREGIERILTGHRWKQLSVGYLKCSNHLAARLVGGVSRRLAHRLDIDPGVGWLPEIRTACQDVRPEDVDAILATASPFSSFSAARQLSQRLGRPYVLDYRDSWTDNPHVDPRKQASRMRNEQVLIRDCSAVTIVSNSCAESLEARYHLGDKIHVISNGYDPEELAGVEPHHFGHFAIVYTGGFYRPKRAITPVMAALKQLLTSGRCRDVDWRFHYYGEHGSHVSEEAAKCGLEGRVVVHGNVSRHEALSAVRGAGVAVVITSVYPVGTTEDRGIVTGKIFEPLGLRVRVLLVAPPGSDAEPMIEATGSGRRYSGDDLEGMATFFAEAMEGGVPSPQRVDQYAWPNLARRFDSVLRGVIPSAR